MFFSLAPSILTLVLFLLICRPALAAFGTCGVACPCLWLLPRFLSLMGSFSSELPEDKSLLFARGLLSAPVVSISFVIPGPVCGRFAYLFSWAMSSMVLVLPPCICANAMAEYQSVASPAYPVCWCTSWFLLCSWIVFATLLLVEDLLVAWSTSSFRLSHVATKLVLAPVQLLLSGLLVFVVL